MCYGKAPGTVQSLLEGHLVCKPDGASRVQRALGSQSLRCLHARGRRPHRRETLRGVHPPGPALPATLHTGEYAGRGHAGAAADALRAGNLHARYRQFRRVRHRARHQGAVPRHAVGGAHPLLTRHHTLHGAARPQPLRVRLLLAGQHRAAALHHQAHGGQDEPRPRHPRGWRADDTPCGRLHPLLLLGAPQPI